LTSAGDFAWVQRVAGGTGDNFAAGVAVSADGAVYSTGYFQGTADFDPSTAVYNIAANGDKEALLAK